MNAYTAYSIALKNDAFKAAARKAEQAVLTGETPVAKFPFIVDGRTFIFGYRHIYDVLAGHEAAPFYIGVNVRPGRRMMNTVVVR